MADSWPRKCPLHSDAENEVHCVADRCPYYEGGACGYARLHAALRALATVLTKTFVPLISLFAGMSEDQCKALRQIAGQGDDPE